MRPSILKSSERYSSQKKLNPIDYQYYQVKILNKEEFMRQIQSCNIPAKFDQHLLDHASEMFGKWGKSWHSDEREYLFENFGINSKKGDSEELKKEKEALRCVLTKMMSMQINNVDAAEIVKNFNRINDPNFKLNV